MILTGFGAFLIGILAFVVFFFFNFRTVEVKGESMEPTFSQGDRLLMSTAYWLVGDIKRGEIVVIKTEDTGETLIKRVKGLPGDTIDFLLMPYSWKLSMGEYKVPASSLYVLGDNRPVSQDSRDFGAVQKSDVLGKVVVFGNEPWLFGVVGVAVLSLVASGVAAMTDKKTAKKEDP
ncbi:MAG: signal peptidase I [Armatimonadetes bacterium]|nr:signal peptidase I [Armatimonadota bacterium]